MLPPNLPCDFCATANFVNEAVVSQPTRLLVRFFNGDEDNGETLLHDMEAGGAFGWEEISETFVTPPNTTDFQIVLEAERMGGRIRLDNITLSDLSDPIPAQAGQDYELGALLAGELG